MKGGLKIKLGLLALISLMMSGCFSPVKYAVDVAPEVVEPLYGDLAISGEVLDRWWEFYSDDALNHFIDVVLENNPTLQISYLNMIDSALALKQAESGYYPSVSLSASVGAGGRIYDDPSIDPTYGFGVSGSYEIDIWGKVRAQKRVAELSAESAADSAAAGALSLVANVVSQWFSIQYERENLSLTSQLLEISEDYYELVQAYYRTGQATGIDVLEQYQQIETLRSTVHSHEVRIRTGLSALRILSGGKASAEVSDTLPEAISVGGTVDVETLLTSRPDLRQARRTAEQADARVVIALADRLPTLRLSASLMYRNGSIVDLFKSLLWDMGASFAVNIFDGFNKTTAIERAKVSYLMQRFSYGFAVMQAVSEVESALLNMQLRERLLSDARAEVERQREILEVSREYFIGGTVTYNRVLSALKSLISSSQSELNARKELLNAQITLFKAMGGGNWLEAANEAGEKRNREQLEALDNDTNSEREEGGER